MSATLVDGISSLFLNITHPLDTDGITPRDDLMGVKVWISSTGATFTPSQSNLVFDGLSLSITIPDLTPGILYYVKYALISEIDPEDYVVSSALTGTPLFGGFEEDNTPPPTPTGVVVQAGLTHIVVKHDQPTYTVGRGHSKTWVFGVKNPASGASFNDAIIIGEFEGTYGAIASDPATIWKIWLKWQSVQGVLSTTPAGGVTGFLVEVGEDPSTLLQLLAGTITEGELGTFLNSRIDLVDNPGTGLVTKVANLESVFGTTSTASAFAKLAEDASAAAIQAKVDALLAKAGSEAAKDSVTLLEIETKSAASSAKISADSAVASATTAEGAVSTVKNSSDLAVEASIAAGNSAKAAQQSEFVANTLSTAAETASTVSQTYSIVAQAARDDAQSFANSAIAASQTANTYATDAASYSQTALNSKIAAESAFGDTAIKAQAAKDSETVATTSAAEVAQSANLASTSSATAITAAGEAAGYRNESFTSAFNAENYAISALESRNLSANNSGLAEGYAIAANNSANLAQTYSDSAGVHAQAASSSSLTASNSASSAGLFRDEAVSASTTAQGHATSAASSLTTLRAIASTAQSVFVESWENSNALTAWQNYDGLGELDIVSSTDAISGSKILRVGNNSGNDQVWIVHTNALVFDSTKTYRITVRARQTAGTGKAYFGWAGVLSDGTTLCNVSGNNSYGSQHYHGAPSVAMSGAWTTYIGYSKGWGTTVGDSGAGTKTNPSKFHPNIRYIRPLILVNYSGVSGTTEIDSFVVDDVTDAVEVSSAIEVEAKTRADSDGTINSRYTVKIDDAGSITGYGLISATNNATPTSSFNVQAGKFTITPPAVSSATSPQGTTAAPLYKGYTWIDTSVNPPVTRYWTGTAWTTTPQILPFTVLTAPTKVGDTTVNPGVYIDSAVIRDASIGTAKIGDAVITNAKIANDLDASKITAGQLSAQRIDTKGLTIKDAEGNVIFGSGANTNPTNFMSVPAGWLNSNVSLTGLGYKGDLDATKGADWSSNVSNKPTSIKGLSEAEYNTLNTLTNTSAASNLIDNGFLSEVALDGRPRAVKAVYGSSVASTISYQDTAKTIVKLYSDTDNTIGAGFAAFRVLPGKRYNIVIKVKASTAASSGFYFRIQELDSSLDYPNTHISYSGGETGVVETTRQITDFAENVAITTSWTVYDWTYTPTATAKWASPIFLNWDGMGTRELHIGPIIVTDASNYVDNTSQLTDGAQLGEKANYANLTGTPASSIANSSISISSKGELSGAGGGQVTITGLGYDGDLKANKTSVDAEGKIQGVSEGAGTVVQNTKITVNADGSLTGAGEGSVTIAGLGYKGDLDATAGATAGTNLKDSNGRIISDANLLGNLLDSTVWTVGTVGSSGVFVQNPTTGSIGFAGSNTIVLSTLPDGTRGAVWRASSGNNAAGAQGGWNTSNFNIDHTKVYRFSVWIRRVGAAKSGYYYLGVGGDTVRNLNDNVVNGNPYFMAAGRADLPQDVWVLVVGFVYNSGYSGGTISSGGVYNGSTGKLIYACTDYKWAGNTITSSYHRTYQYYSGSTNDVQDFWNPRVDLVDGTEPSINSLIFGNGYKGDIDATKGATFGDTNGTGRNISGQITSGNVSTFIAAAAIGSAYIASLEAGKINTTSLSAIQANAGTITAGQLRSNDGKFLIDLDNKYITITT